jgi:hypothetical protein
MRSSASLDAEKSQSLPAQRKRVDMRASAAALDGWKVQMADCAQAKKLGQLQTWADSAKPAQRKLKLDGAVWDQTTASQFKEEYADDLKLILSSLCDVRPNCPGTIDEALTDPRIMGLYRHGAGTRKSYAGGLAESSPKQTKQGREHVAWGFPIVMSRPEDGAEVMKVTGLSDCVGVFVFQIDQQCATQKIAATHVVSSDVIKAGKMTNAGLQQLRDTVELAKGGAYLLGVVVRSTTKNKSELDRRSYQAAHQSLVALEALDVAKSIVIAPYSEVSYRLDSEGDVKRF